MSTSCLVPGTGIGSHELQADPGAGRERQRSEEGDSGARRRRGRAHGGVRADGHAGAARAHSVTVYQLGWRLGGKGASGRNAASRQPHRGARAARLVRLLRQRLPADARRLRGARPRRPARRSPPSTTPSSRATGSSSTTARTTAGRPSVRVPDQPAAPGRRRRAADVLGDRGRGVRLGAERLARPARGRPRRPRRRRRHRRSCPTGSRTSPRELAADLLALPIDGAEQLLGLAERLARARAGSTDHRLPLQAAQPALLVQLLKSFRDWLWIAVARRAATTSRDLRFFFTAVDAGVSTLAGIVEDGVLEHGFDVINDEEWAAWLRSPRRQGGDDRRDARGARARAALRLRRRVRLPAAASIAAADVRRRHRDERPAAARLQLPRIDHVQDAGGHGRRGVRAALRGAHAPAASASSSSTRSPACGSAGTRAVGR